MEHSSSHDNQPPSPPPPNPPPPPQSTMSSSSSSPSPPDISSFPPPPITEMATPQMEKNHEVAADAEDAESRPTMEGRFCDIGLKIAHHGWTCSEERTPLLSKRNFSKLMESINQAIPGFNSKSSFHDNIICNECYKLFRLRRGEECCHPNHNNKYSKKFERYITAEDYFNKYRSIGLFPNQAICKRSDRCCDRVEEIQAQGLQDPNYEETVTKKRMLENLTLIKQIISPSAPSISINKRNLKQQGKLVTKELEQITSTITSGFQNLGLPIPEDNNLGQITQDSKDLQEIMGSLKSRMMGCSQAEKKQLLTLVPTSWTLEKTMKFFGVGKRLVQGSRKRRQETGTILPPIKPKQGRKISQEIKSKIQDFYYQDDISRACPGQKDFFSIKNKETGKRERKQKRYLLSNLRELFTMFNTQHPECAGKVGKSSFMMMRPRECISLTSKGYHNVCVCIHHENVKLLFHAIKISSIKPAISQLVCENGGKDCYYRRCPTCLKSTEVFKKSLRENQIIKDSTNISYRRWLSTDGTQYMTEEKETADFVDFATSELEKLLKHHYISRAQHEFLVDLRKNLKPGEIFIWGDFAENYTPVTQNAVQSDYYNHKQITIHPFAIYWTLNQVTYNVGVSIISDGTTHDTNSFYAFQHKLIPFLVREFAAAQMKISYIHYASDGCAAQYKNRKNFCNLYHHIKDFGIPAEWHFGATAHMKGPADAQGGIAKRGARTASLQGTKITTARDFYDWCKSNIHGIEYLWVPDSEIQQITEDKDLNTRYETITTIAGTQQAHRIEIGSGKIHLYEVSQDTTIMATKLMESEMQVPSVVIDECSIDDWIACVYDNKWYVAVIDEVDFQEEEVKVTFWKPNTAKSIAGTSFISENASCYIKIGQILQKIFPSRASRRSGRTINIPIVVQEGIDRLFKQFQR